jgi:hypothetical protein
MEDHYHNQEFYTLEEILFEGEEDLTNRLAFFLSRLLRAASRF